MPVVLIGPRVSKASNLEKCGSLVETSILPIFWPQHAALHHLIIIIIIIIIMEASW